MTELLQSRWFPLALLTAAFVCILAAVAFTFLPESRRPGLQSTVSNLRSTPS